MKKYLITAVLSLIAIGSIVGVANALPTSRSEQTLLPFLDNTYELGSTTLKWKNIFTNQICLSGVCQNSWSSGASAFSDLTDVTLTSTSTGDTLYFNGTDWVNLAIGAAGKVLKVNGGVPYWGTDLTGGGGTDGNVIYGDLYYYINTSTIPFVFGADATSTNDNLQVVGSAYVSGNLSVGTVTATSATTTNFYTNSINAVTGLFSGLTVTGLANLNGWTNNGNGTSTSLTITSLPSTLLGTNSSGQIISATNATLTSVTTTNIFVSGQTILGSGTGLAKLTSGVLSTITDSSANWNTAYGWGNHAVAGYLTSLLGGLNGIFGNTTTTNATTTNLAVTGQFNFLGTVITNVSTWFNSLFDPRLLSGLNAIFGSSTSTNFSLTGYYRDSASSTGTAGFMLQSTGTSTKWIEQPIGGFSVFASTTMMSAMGNETTTFVKGIANYNEHITKIRCKTSSSTVGIYHAGQYILASTSANLIDVNLTIQAGNERAWGIKPSDNITTSTYCETFGYR